ncbi:MAG TPA: ATP-dependent DNA ligase, partial [bacterium]|nr:ATP-dependent DNA ligase [bacterium]
YGERTPDGVLRHPVFVRVRDDVRPADVVLATSADTAAAAGTAPERSRTDRSAAAGGARSTAGPAAPPGLAFTNLDKIFFPERGLTKGDVVEYYRRIAPHLVPHLRDRPLTLRRFPNGIHGDDFFQKDVTDAPAFVRRMRVWSDQGKRDIEFVVGADGATLLWLAQLGCIEMHAWFSRIAPVPGRGAGRPTAAFAGSEAAIEGSVLNYPDSVVFDIDPFLYPPGTGPTRRHGELDPDYSRRGFDAAREVALWVGDALEALGLRTLLKTSGKTGLHVFVPIERRYTYAETHAFAKTVATWLADAHPDRVTTAWAVTDRVGKVFVDYNQNVRGKTLASVYSLRPVPEATVSVPVTWAELRAGVDPLRWTISTVFDRLAAVGDLWADILRVPQRLNVGAPAPRGGARRTPAKRSAG